MSTTKRICFAALLSVLLTAWATQVYAVGIPDGEYKRHIVVEDVTMSLTFNNGERTVRLRTWGADGTLDIDNTYTKLQFTDGQFTASICSHEPVCIEITNNYYFDGPYLMVQPVIEGYETTYQRYELIPLVPSIYLPLVSF